MRKWKTTIERNLKHFSRCSSQQRSTPSRWEGMCSLQKVYRGLTPGCGRISPRLFQSMHCVLCSSAQTWVQFLAPQRVHFGLYSDWDLWTRIDWYHHVCMNIIKAFRFMAKLFFFFLVSRWHYTGTYSGNMEIKLFFFFFGCGTSGLMWDLSSQTRDWTLAVAVKVPNPNH